MIPHLLQLYKDTSFTIEGETIASYVASLRAIAKDCEYGNTLNMTMLRDCLVCGINHQALQRRLLAEKKLTFDKALEIALAAEAADKDMRQIQKPPVIHYQSHGKGLKPPRKDGQPRNPRHPTTCHRCLGEHTPQTCPFKQAECHKCKKVGHIAKACKTKSQKERVLKQPRATNYVDDVQESVGQHTTLNNSYELFTLSSKGQEPILVSVTLNQTPVQMELDTGASLSLLNKQTFDVIANKSHTTLKTTDVQLKTYTGETVEVLGEVELTVTYGEQTKQLVVHVVAGNGPNLMGRDRLCSLKVSIGEIHKVQVPNGLPELLDKHKQAFSDGLGTFKGGKVTLQIDPQSKPKFFKVRTLPFSLKEKVEKDLKL